MENQNGNMYPGVKTWNPLAGECPHKCVYCSTKSLMRYPVIKEKYSGPLRIDEKQLYKTLGSGKTIFVCAQNDLFAESVYDSHIIKILFQCRQEDNTYLFQTKNPARMKDFATLFPEKTILCTTIETNRDYYKLSDAPIVWERAIAMEHHSFFEIHVTLEPLVDFDLEDMVELVRACHPKIVHIGADSKGNNLPEPSKEKVLVLIEELQKFTVIDKKTNLSRLLR